MKKRSTYAEKSRMSAVAKHATANSAVCRKPNFTSQTLFAFALSVILALTSTGCLKSEDLAGTVITNPGTGLTGGFKGCLTAKYRNQNAIDVTYEWPSNTLSVSVLRNGIPVYTAINGKAGMYTDYGLLEGVPYTYTCSATFTDSTIKVGNNEITLYPLSINAPTFYGITSATVLTPSTAQVDWIVATGVPTYKYVIVAKLGSDPTENDFNSSLSATQDLINKKQLIYAEEVDATSASVVLSGLGDELPYHFAVQACSKDNNCSVGDGTNDYQTYTMSDAGAPQTLGVASVQMVAGAPVLTAPWNASLGQITTRKVYRNTTGGTDINTYTNVQNFTVTDPTLTPTDLTLTGALAESTTYYFIVRDVDVSTQENTSTLTVSINTGDLTPPPGFTGIETTANLVSNIQGEVLIKWKAPTDWSDYKGFTIYTVSSTNVLTAIQSCNCSAYGCPEHLLTCNVTGFTPFRTYKFHVRAYDESGNVTTYLSVPLNSSTKRVADTTPPVFTSAAILGFNSGITLLWDPATDNQYGSEPGIFIKYQVWRKTDATFTDPLNPALDADGQAALATITDESYLDAAVADGHTYYYTLCALDTTLNRTCDGVVYNKQIKDVTPPVVSVIADTKTLTNKVWNLSWTMSDAITIQSLLQVGIRRTVTSSPQAPTTNDPVYLSGQNIVNLINEGDPVIAGTEGVLSYVNYLVSVTDLEGNTTSTSTSIMLDNAPPTSDPVLLSTDPVSPSNQSTTPSVVGSMSLNSATIALYSDAGCTTALAGGSGTKAQFSSGLSLSLVANATTSLYAVATTSALTPGDCVLIGSYQHDSVPPTVASLAISTSPNNNPVWDVTFGAISGDATHYCIKLNNPVKPLASASCWASTSALPSTYNASPAEGANIAYVWVKDGAANVSSATVQSNTLTWDGTAPTWNNSVAIVFTSPETSGWKHQGATLDVNYTANAVDLVPVTGVPGSGLNRYDYALGTGASGNAASNIIAWTSLNLPTGAQTIPLTGLSLVEGVTYYFSVRAVDNYDNKQTYTKSFQVDLTDPAAPTVDSLSEGQTIALTNPTSNSTSFTGTCDETAGTTVVTGGAGVTISASGCTGTSLYGDASFTYNSAARSIISTVTKPSGRFATSTRTVNTSATPYIAGHIASTGGCGTNSLSNCTVSMPTNIQAGDLLIVFISTSSGISGGNVNWTSIQVSTYLYIKYKIATGTEGATQLFSHGSSSFSRSHRSLAIKIRGANAATPIDVLANAVLAAPSITFPTVTPTVSPTLLLNVFISFDQTPNTTTFENSMTKYVFDEQTGCISLAYKALSTTDPTGDLVGSYTGVVITTKTFGRSLVIK